MCDENKNSDLKEDVLELQRQMKSVKTLVCSMKETVENIQDIVRSFRLVAAAAKYITIIGGGLAVIYAAIQGVWTHLIPHK